MSFTSTIPATSNAKKIERTTSLLLSPSKRRRIESLPDTRVETSPSKASESPCALPRTDNASVSIDATAHRPAEVWKWTLTRDAVAPCFSKDVFEMRESGVKGTPLSHLFACAPLVSAKLICVGMARGGILLARTCSMPDCATGRNSCWCASV